MWKSSGKIALIGLLSTLIASGCGSLSQITSGSGGGRSARGPGGRSQDGRLAMRQVGTFTGSMDGKTGQLTLQADPPGGASTRATAYGPANALSLTGTGSPIAGGILRGNVTLTSNNPIELFDVKAVLLSISSSSVSANNATGTTNLSGTSRPYWNYGHLDSTQNQVTRSWEFRNSGGVSFTFRVAIYANTWTYSGGDGGTLRASSFISTTTGWAVGDGGKILKTQDGGATWTVQNAGTSSDLKDVSFANSSQGWAVGSGGKIVATSDGGVTWRHQQAIDSSSGFPTPIEVDLLGVKFASSTRGIAVGAAQTILLTTNGGSTWQQVYGGGAAGTLFDVCFVNSTTGWAVGDSATVLRTTDGGNTWTKQPIPSSQWQFQLAQYNTLQAVHFADANKGWAVGAGGWLIATTDGGATWSKKTSGTQSNLFTVFFANGNTGWAAGTGGVLIKTTNGGTSWSVPGPTVSLDLFGLTGLSGNTNNLWATGRAGLLYYSTNGGSSWTRSGTASSGTLNGVWFADSARGWAVGSSGSGGVMLRTTNSGASWASMVGAGQNGMEDVCFINANEGWAVGAAGLILHTTNGGQTWTSQDWSGLHIDGVTPPTLYGIRFLDSQNGWACGSKSTLLRTTDGGVTWEDVFPPVQSTYRKIARLDENNGWIVGSSGVIIATQDGGVSWSPVNSGTTKNLNNIDVVPGTGGPSVWAVGDSGTLLHSTDGITWAPVDLGERANLNGVDFLPDGRTGWIVGNAFTLPTGDTMAVVYRTTDNGTTWEPIDAGTGSSLKSIHMLSADEGCAVGMSGAIKLFR